MLYFACEFPVRSPKRTRYFEVLGEWLAGSAFSPEDLADFGSEQGKLDRGAQQLEWLAWEGEARIATAVRWTRIESGLVWDTSVVLSGGPGGAWAGVRALVESMYPAPALPDPGKPLVASLLLDAFGGAQDGRFPVPGGAIRLAASDVDLAARVIDGAEECSFPVVYVSCLAQGGYPVDPDALAAALAGMAHVMVEPDRPFFQRLLERVSRGGVFGGCAGIYWPAGTGRTALFQSSQHPDPDALRRLVWDQVRRALVNRRPRTECRWPVVQELVAGKAIEALRAAKSGDLDAWVQEFDRELQAKEDQLRQAEAANFWLRAQVQSMEEQAANSGITLRRGQERDLYPGEIEFLVREAIEIASRNMPPNSRRLHVLSDLLEANPGKGPADDWKDQVKQLLRGYQSMDNPTREGLIKLGFEIQDGGKHWKLFYQGDSRYPFTLAKTGSDHRGGLNAAQDIARLFF